MKPLHFPARLALGGLCLAAWAGAWAQSGGPVMMPIPGGAFQMGDHHGFVDPAHPSDELPLHSVRITAFYLGKTHVTVQQYCDYLNSAMGQGLIRVSAGLVYAAGGSEVLFQTRDADQYSMIGHSAGTFSVLGGRGAHPVTSVMWAGAAAYCNWLSAQGGYQAAYNLATGECDFAKNGYRLPTEAEWEYAARGGQTNPYYVYPWGNTADLARANFPSSGDPYEGGTLPLTTPVGFYDGQLRRKADYGWPGSQDSYQTLDGTNAYGLCDMAGNAWQWCNDWYGQGYYSLSPASDPPGPDTGTAMPDGKPYRVLRGGNWYNGDGSDPGHARVANRDPAYYRGPQDPNHPYYHIGFRVARRDNAASLGTQTVGLFVNTGRAWPGYTLVAPKHYGSTYLINNAGQVVHTWSGSKYEPGQAVYLLENGHLLRPCMVKGALSSGGGEGGRIEEYDWDGNLVWQFDYSTSEYTQHHDIKPLPNGNVLMLVVEKRTYDEAVAAGFDPSKFQPQIATQGYMLPDSVVEIKPSLPSGGTVVWQWRVWDHLIQDYASTKSNYGNVAAHPELINPGADGGQIPSFWNHMNAIYYHAGFDQIMLSVRGNSEAWVIDHSTTTAEAAGHTGGKRGKGGDLLYRWGNPIMYRAGTKADQKLYQQHDTQWIEAGCPGAGNIIAFNNGLGRNYSTADEWTPPVDANGNYTLTAGSAFGPSSFTWSYKADPPASLYAEAISGAQRLPNGNTLICDGTHGTFIEVTSAGETVWKYLCPVVTTGPLTQGTTIPSDTARPDELLNAVFRVRRYPASYVGLSGRSLTPSGTIELAGANAPSAPSVTTQPQAKSGTSGDSVTFTAAISGTPAASLQWQRRAAGSSTWENLREGGAYSGVTSATLTISKVATGMSGDQFRCVATNTSGTVTTSAVTLTVASATSGLLQYPAGLAIDDADNLYVADSSANTILKITSAGVVSTLAGQAGTAGAQDGSASSASFNQPSAVAVDPSGNVYVADTGNATIRRISAAGTVTTLAGSSSSRGSKDGTGSSASFNAPGGITIDPVSGDLYVADTQNATIRRVTSAGSVTTLAGTAGSRGETDGTGAAARFNYPGGVALDAATGYLYVADTYNHTIRRITSAAVVTTVAGSAGLAGATDFTGIDALFNQPVGLAVDAKSTAGVFFVADTGNGTIRMVTPGTPAAVTTVAGTAGIAGLADGTTVLFNQPRGVVVDSARNLYVADTGNGVIRKVTRSTGSVSTVALTAASSGSGNSGGSGSGSSGGTSGSTTTTTTSSGGGGGGGDLGAGLVVLLAALVLARGLRGREVAP